MTAKYEDTADPPPGFGPKISKLMPTVLLRIVGIFYPHFSTDFDFIALFYRPLVFFAHASWCAHFLFFINPNPIPYTVTSLRFFIAVVLQLRNFIRILISQNGGIFLDFS